MSLAEVTDALIARPPTLGTGRLLCVDGPSGSGKSTLAGTVAAKLDAPLLRMDDLYDGWDCLDRLDPLVLPVLEPLARDESSSYRRYDWHEGAFAETHRLDPAPVLVLEGVGAGSRAWSHLCTLLVWVEAPSDVRLERSVARDGEELRPRLERWMADEVLLFAREGTRERADLHLIT